MSRIACIARLGFALAIVWWPRPAAAYRVVLSEERTCRASDWIVFARVVERVTFERPTPEYKWVESLLTLQVESVGHGEVPDVIHLIVVGGVTKSGSRIVASEGLKPFLDKRYLLFLNVRDPDAAPRPHPPMPREPAAPSAPGGSAARQGPELARHASPQTSPGGKPERSAHTEWVPEGLDRDAYLAARRVTVVNWFEVDPAATLPPQDIMEAAWVEHCSPALQQGLFARPTQYIIPLLPESFIDWCEHY